MEYQKEIDDMFVRLFREDDMSDDEYNEFVEKVLVSTGLTKEELNDNLLEGVANGYPVEVQMDLVDQAFATLKLDRSSV